MVHFLLIVCPTEVIALIWDCLGKECSVQATLTFAVIVGGCYRFTGILQA